MFENKGQLYFIWSGWEGDTNGRQSIYLTPLKNPWTLAGPRVLVSTPTYAWERNSDLGSTSNPPHVDVNEGPEVLQHDNKLFLVYSASGCWTDFYALGLLTASASSDLLNPASWTKKPTPVFQQSPTNKVYAPGHNSFSLRPMAPKAGCSTTPTTSPARAAAASARRVCSPSPGAPMAPPILGSQCRWGRCWRSLAGWVGNNYFANSMRGA